MNIPSILRLVALATLTCSLHVDAKPKTVNGYPLTDCNQKSDPCGLKADLKRPHIPKPPPIKTDQPKPTPPPTDERPSANTDPAIAR